MIKISIHSADEYCKIDPYRGIYDSEEYPAGSKVRYIGDPKKDYVVNVETGGPETIPHGTIGEVIGVRGGEPNPVSGGFYRTLVRVYIPGIPLYAGDCCDIFVDDVEKVQE